MYVDSSPAPTRHFARTARREANAQTAASRPSATAAARRTRLADAVVSQWLLEQLPTERRFRVALESPRVLTA
jgi:hypothetical protein